MKKKLLFMIFVLFVTNASLIAQDSKDILMTIDDKAITKQEFIRIYKKNNTTDQNTIDHKTVDEYAELFINFKLKVIEAENQGLDTIKTFIKELAGYRKQLAKPYFKDESVIDSLILEAHNRLKEEVKASHILIRIISYQLNKKSLDGLEKDSVPKDICDKLKLILNKEYITKQKFLDAIAKQVSNEKSKKYKKQIFKNAIQNPEITEKKEQAALELITQIKKRLDKGEDFVNLVHELSDGYKVDENHGDLGYFSGFNMIYKFETVAYSLPVGSISEPFRTKFGYHIIKTFDRRPASGKVKTAHIMTMTPKNMLPEDTLKAYNKINECYDSLMAGKDFAELAAKYSEDKKSGKKGGILKPFGRTGSPSSRMIIEFENAAFNLKNEGDISKPIKTPYGWHIIKLIEKINIKPLDKMKEEIKRKIASSSRGNLSETVVIDRLIEKYKLQEFDNLSEFYQIVDTSIFKGNWTIEKAAKLNKPLLKFGDTTITQQDFAKYLTSNKRKIKQTPVSEFIDNKYDRYKQTLIIAYQDARLEQDYPNFKYLMQEYHDGILLFELTDKMVWSMAVKDSAGLQEFHVKNKNKYIWDKRLDATIYSYSDDNIQKKAIKLIGQKEKKGLTDKEIVNTFADGKIIPLKVNETKKYLKGDNEYIDKFFDNTETTSVLTDKKLIIHINNRLDSEPKKLSEIRGLVTADYQTHLEEEWIQKLRKKYKISVDKKILSTIK